MSIQIKNKEDIRIEYVRIDSGYKYYRYDNFDECKNKEGVYLKNTLDKFRETYSGKIVEYNDFEIIDKNENHLIYGDSGWRLINLNPDYGKKNIVLSNNDNRVNTIFDITTPAQISFSEYTVATFKDPDGVLKKIYFYNSFNEIGTIIKFSDMLKRCEYNNWEEVERDRFSFLGNIFHRYEDHIFRNLQFIYD